MKRREFTHSEDSIYEASSSTTSPHVGNYEGGTKRPKGNDYEVFLSFRGEDTRKGFTDYLYTSLVEKGIHVFRDNNELRVGEEIGPELLCSIRQSTILIPIISKNYAFSKWCLRELAQILKCKRRRRQMVWPIFYKVKPSQVRHLKGRFEDAIKAHKENWDEMVLKEWKKALKEVKEWEEALKEVGSLKGWESENIHNGHEGAFVKTIVRNIMGELKRLFLLNVPEQLVGIDDRTNEIMSLIDDKLNDTKIIGLYGMGGIGKTTLAKVLYDKLSSRFEYRGFVENIRETSQRQGIECILNKLIYDIIGSSGHVSSVDEGIGVIKSLFTSKKVLVLLDDMDGSTTHLNALVKDGSWFGAGSIVIITTRDKRILDKAKAGYMFPLDELSMDQSLILFSRHAFRKDSLPSDYKVLSHDIVSTTGGLPLALEVTGSCLCGMTREVWEDTLKKLKKVPNKEVQETLKISYEALDNEQKQIFLDIACFFIGSCKQNPTYMWDACELFPKSGIEVLSLMSLIKIDEGKLVMHDQLRDLGREIVRLKNSNEPQKHSRLWIYEEALDVLNTNKGTRKIEALSLGKCGEGIGCTAEQFKKMTNLRFLQVDGVNFTGDFHKLLPKLRWLQWNGCPSDFAANNFHPKKLVILDLSYSAISKDWGGWVPLKMATELKVLNLMSCPSLRRTPDLSTFKRLEILILAYCENLKELHPSIGDIKTLVSLNVTNCNNLKELPEGIGRMVELRDLNIQGTAIEALPKFIGAMKELKVILASDCKKLAHIPSSIGNLASLQSLFLNDCSSLTKIPNSIGNLASLIELHLGRTSITKLPESIGSLQNLRILDISRADIRELPDTIGMLTKLQRLEAWYCKNLERLPCNICKLISLKELRVGGCEKLRELPELSAGLTALTITCQERSLPHLSQLTRLEELSLYDCHWLEYVPKLPIGLSTLFIGSCGKLKALMNLSDLKHLRGFLIHECPSLERSPDVSNFKRTRMGEL